MEFQTPLSETQVRDLHGKRRSLLKVSDHDISSKFRSKKDIY